MLKCLTLLFFNFILLYFNILQLLLLLLIIMIIIIVSNNTTTTNNNMIKLYCVSLNELIKCALHLGRSNMAIYIKINNFSVFSLDYLVTSVKLLPRIAIFTCI